MKKNNAIINIFCSISSNRLKEVNRLLIPSLEKQAINYPIHLSLIEYTGTKTFSRKDIIGNNLKLNILYPSKPLGFGEAHNYAFNKISPKNYFLIVNSDIYLDKHCIKNLVNTFNPAKGLIEARQIPFAHPKDSPQEKPFETNWASGSCLLINSKFFKKVNGFDPNYWMYLEDVDLSWKSWINGYSVIHNPEAIAYHYTGLYFKYTDNSYQLEHFWSIRNFLYISYIYFGNKGLNRAYKMVKNSPIDKNLVSETIANFIKLKDSSKLKQIKIPKELRDRIKIYGLNKFSRYPL